MTDSERVTGQSPPLSDDGGMFALESDVISDLRSLLNDQYDAQSVLRELMQNAEDAKRCTQLHLGWMSDWPEGAHPLLTGPTLVVLNDGLFECADRVAIRQLKRGTKGGESRFVGKFGVGLKSVFHLCEAFFFAASPDQPASSGSPFFAGVNPWGRTMVHPNWQDTSRAKSVVIERLEAWDHGCERWFSLAFPLRTESQLEGKEPIIRAALPDYADFLSHELPHRVAAATLLLRHVTRVCLWDWVGETARMELRYVVEVRPGHGHCREFDRMARDAQLPLHGAVYLNGAIGEQPAACLRYAGAEVLLADADLARLKDDPDWPKIDVTDPVTGRQDYVRLGAEPHAAVVFSARPAKTPGASQLRVIQAVFLPLSEGGEVVETIGGNTDYALTLHGDFFVETGRRVIQVFKADDQSSKALWQRGLWERGLWPLLLPALDEFVRRAEVQPDDVCEVTRALDTYLRKEQGRLGQVCRDHHWGAWLNPKGTTDWRPIPAEQDFLELPSLAGFDPELLSSVFPAIRSLADRLPLTFADVPRITARPPSPWDEHPTEVQQLIDSIPDKAFEQREALDYATRLLRHLRGSSVLAEVKRLLQQRASEAVAKLRWSRVEKNRDAFRRLLQELGSDYWVSVSVPQDHSAVLTELCELSLERLPVPAELAAGLSGGPFSAQDCNVILGWLASEADIRPERKNAVALSVLRAAAPADESLRRMCGSHRVFLARKLDEEATRLLSWEELANLHARDQLYGSRSPFAGPLHQAVRDLDLWAPASPEVFDALLLLEERASLDKAACFALLRAKPQLHSAQERAALLDALLGGLDRVSETDYRAAFRYLLHGSREHFTDTQTPLLTTADADGAANSVVGRVAKAALGRRQQNWRWVPLVLADHLTREQERALGVERLSPEALEKLLGEAGVDWLADLSLTKDERIELLCLIRSDDLWRRLPLHESVTGKLVSLTGQETGPYLVPADGYTVPEAFREVVDIIKRPQSSELLDRYNRSLTLWTPMAALREACRQPQPERFCREMLEALAVVPEQELRADDDLCRQLRETRWLPTSDGRVVGPCDVIHLPGLEDELRRLLATPELKGAFTCEQNFAEHVRKHRGFDVVKEQLLPPLSDALQMLGACLGEVGAYHIGALEGLREAEDELSTVLGVAGECGLSGILPGVSLLKSLAGPCGTEHVARHVVPELLRPLALAKLVDCLNALHSWLQTDPRQRKKAGLQVHDWYLASLVDHPEFQPGSLSKLQLLNGRGEWQDPAKLCMYVEGIDEGFVLHERHQDILRRAQGFRSEVEPPPAEGAAEAEGAPASDLRAYLRSWEGIVPAQVIGAFLAFMGDDPVALEVAEDFLRPRSVRSVRDQLNWMVEQGGHEQMPFRPVGFDMNVHQAMNHQCVRFQQLGVAKEKRVPNLVGGWFDAPLSEKYETLFVGRPQWSRGKGKPVFVVDLRTVDPAQLGAARCRELLLESARWVLTNLYSQPAPNLDELWEELAHADQFDIEVTQDRILADARLHFQQLGIPRLPAIRELVREWEELEDRKAEHAHYGGAASSSEDADPEKGLAEVQARLRSLIETNPEVQQQTLAAVREKMSGHFRYGGMHLTPVYAVCGVSRFGRAADQIPVGYMVHGCRLLHQAVEQLAPRT